ncbi:M23 family metallopeptidase [Hymenobacter sp. M29]|uniref:M23 family metallopeptidase n=1 Tax=Hymenobacter mellowenesis TaxID=3063995 RepID=A0ABT9ADP2_9BACT|nr:M23 family metallopeptidase [Hymenobacter sp. M29]MDO7847489.1 M23 family metallopeptidase [Hymenobacter sp. M29]
MRATGWIAVVAALSSHRPAQAQAQLANVYHVDNHQGVVFLYAENHAFVPYTITLKARLVNMQSTDALPMRLVVFPAKQPQLLTTFTYTPGLAYSYHYDYPAQLGIYTSRPPDTTYVYRFPSDSVQVFRPTPSVPKSKRTNITHHDYLFDLPARMPVLAARNGIVVNYREDCRKNTRSAFNFITVFHEDGSYASYLNIAPSSVGVSIGQYVNKGQRIATSDARAKPAPLVFVVNYPGEAAALELPVRFARGNQGPARP